MVYITSLSESDTEEEAVAAGASDQPSDESGDTPPKMMSTNGELGSLVDFNKKASAASIINKINNASSSYASSSEKMVKSSSSSSSSSSSLLSKKAQIMHAMSTQEMKQQQQSQQQQNEMFQENRNFCRSVSVTSNSSSSSDSRLKMLSNSSSSNHQGLSSSCLAQRGISVDEPLCEEDMVISESSPQEMKFEQKRMSATSKMKVSTSDGYTSEKMAATNQERKRLQTGSVSYEEKSASSAMKEKLEAEGFSSEKIAAVRQDQVQLKTADSIQQQQRTAMAASMKLSTDEFTAEKVAMAKQEERHMFAQGMVQAEKSSSSSSSAKMTFSSKGINKSSICSQNVQVDFGNMSSLEMPFGSITSNGIEPFGFNNNQDTLNLQGLDDDIKILSEDCASCEVENAKSRFEARMLKCVEKLRSAISNEESTNLLSVMSGMVKKAWAVPNHGHDLGTSMCNILRKNGGLKILVHNCCSENADLQFRSAELLEQCMSTENRTYVVEHGLEKVVRVACTCSNKRTAIHSQVGTGILEHLFKHSEKTCSDVIQIGGLKHIVYNCRNSDVETLRHCATALANLSLYGGPENQEAMIRHKVPWWLFTLAFNYDDNIKYYACLAISSLVANKEIEAAVLQSGTLDLVEPFVTSHSPEEFAKSYVGHVHGQSKNWLQRLVNVLESKREEARSLAAFHFAMEAGIKKRQGNTEIFKEVHAVTALKKVASSPNAIASKFAACALQLIGEELPHKLSQQVPLWTEVDVKEWVRQIGFDIYTTAFLNSRVDGDLLLQLTEDMLKEDIGIKNGILRKRFLRELSQLKRMADYTSCDTTYLNQVLQSLGQEFSQYTYQLLRCGIQKETLKYISDEHLFQDCGIDNSIHRLRIAHAIRGLNQQCEEAEEEEDQQKSLDVFVSYRRSNGSQLASLLKVHLQLRGFSVFIDVERLEAGKFDNNLLNSIRQAKHFLLVLTPNALDRCMNDTECKDWIHKETVEALQSQCNIIPILDNFQYPEPETLPEDMRAICYFNGVRWIHDYQDACVDKLERFLRGEMNTKNDGPLARYTGIGGAGTPGNSSTARGNPIYQRSASNESNKGSTCSDKEISSSNRMNEVSHC